MMTAAKQFGLLLRLSLALGVALGAAGLVASDQDCLACHGDPGMKSESGKSLHVDAAKHKSSVHGDLGCTTCHVGVKEYPHPKPMRMPACATCHDRRSRAGSAERALDPGQEACASCHGKTHEVQPPTKLVPQQCATCHEDAVHGYQQGVHAVARKDGDEQAPTCLSCHGSPHQILAADDPKSPVHHNNIPATCATCHCQEVRHGERRRKHPAVLFLRAERARPARSPTDPPRPPSAPTATACTKSAAPATRNRPSSSSTFR